MLDELKRLWEEEIFRAVVMLVFLFVGVFGAVNWHNHVHPDVPTKSALMSQETYDQKVADYQRRVERVGQDAVISRMWAIPIAIFGFGGFAICFLRFAQDYGP